MRAAYYESNGPAREVLRVADVDTPQAGRGEVRVRLRTSGVNPSDVKSRAGLTRKIAFPRVIPHSDGAGEIDAVGEGVSPARVGERVWVWNGQWRRPFGTAAEWIVLPSEQAVRLPANVTMEAGACLGIPAYTGYQGVLLARAKEGSTVSGLMDTLATMTRCSDLVKGVTRERVGERVMAITAKRGVDAVIEMDLAANARLLPTVLAPNGVVAVYGSGAAEASIPFQFLLQNSITLQFFLVYLMPAEMRQRATADITRMLEQGELIHNVAQTFARRHGGRARGGRKRQGDGQYRGQTGLARGPPGVRNPAFCEAIFRALFSRFSTFKFVEESIY